MYKILIIEDDEIIVQIVKRHLESWGYEVFQIEDFTHVIQSLCKRSTAGAAGFETAVF